MNPQENETEYDYNLGQGRSVQHIERNSNQNTWIISILLVIGLAVIAYKALKPFFI